MLNACAVHTKQWDGIPNWFLIAWKKYSLQKITKITVMLKIKYIINRSCLYTICKSVYPFIYLIAPIIYLRPIIKENTARVIAARQNVLLPWCTI